MLRIAILITCVFLAAVIWPCFGQTCGRRTSASPKEGTLFSTLDAHTVRRIEGYVSDPTSRPLDNVIVQLFRYLPIRNGEEDYQQIQRITSKKPIESRYIARGGHFCFASITRGKYLVRAGHATDSQFSALHIIVKVSSKVRKKRILEARPNLSI